MGREQKSYFRPKSALSKYDGHQYNFIVAMFSLKVNCVVCLFLQFSEFTRKGHDLASTFYALVAKGA